MLNVLVTFYLSVIVARSLVYTDTINFNGRIAGNRPISECVNGFKQSEITSNNSNHKMYITTSQLAREAGYPAEEHVVQTDDGYILTLHRIPGKRGAPPVFLQHGLICSSFDWLVTGKQKALAFRLADKGYDVWLGNFRGSTYSRCHLRYRPTSYKFWDFSWHEIAIYDLPAMISYVTNATCQRIIYIGHSMGTTSFFVMSIKRPDIASKVKVMMAVAPIAFMDHSTSPVLLFAPFSKLVEFFAKPLDVMQPFSQGPALETFVEYACTLSLLERRVCSSIILSFISGFNPGEFNYTLVPDIFYQFPAGSSLKTLVHYAQAYNSKRFQYYDYGSEKNLKLYNSSQPPSYDISKITVPVGIFWSESDVFANPIDVMRLYELLPNKILNYKVEFSNFNHLDYLYGIDAPKYVYEKLLSEIDNYK